MQVWRNLIGSVGQSCVEETVQAQDSEKIDLQILLFRNETGLCGLADARDKWLCWPCSNCEGNKAMFT